MKKKNSIHRGMVLQPGTTTIWLLIHNISYCKKDETYVRCKNKADSIGVLSNRKNQFGKI